MVTLFSYIFRAFRLSGALVAVLLLVLSACSEEKKDQPEAPKETGKAAPEVSPVAIPPLPGLDKVNGDELREELRRKAEKKQEQIREQNVPSGDELGELVESTLDFIEMRFTNDRLFFSRYIEEFDRKIRQRQDFAPLLREIYSPRKYELVLHSYEDKVPVMQEEGRKLLDLIQEMPTHGLAASDYRLDTLRKELESYETVKADYLTAREGEFAAREKAFWKLLSEYREVPREEDLRVALKELGLTNRDLVTLKNFQIYYQKLLQAKAALNELAADIDMDLLSGFFRFMLDFQYLYRAHPFKTTPASSRSISDFESKLRLDYQKAAPGFAEYMRQFIPDNPIYQRLREGLVFYEKLKADGEIGGLKIKGTLKKGSKGEMVRTLGRRLALEGYLDPAQVGTVYGDALVEAVRWYQRIHQLEVDGKIGGVTRGSINVSMERRIASIRLGLQRWRESDIHRDKPDMYVRINIPQFELEFWENNQLVRSHRIVVGNTKDETNLLRKKKGFFNHTALLKSRIETIVLNPRWYPPPRLQEELLLDLEKEPDYFEKNNYGIITHEDGKEVIFQKPGPQNALGLVKFLFPNEASIYIHDTNKKALFNRPVRAYSHGCMRLEKPLDLARYFLERFNGMDKKDVQKILELEKESWQKLKTTIPIFIEYCSVSAGEDGKIQFFIDIYKYDRAYWDNQLPVQLTQDLTDNEVKRMSGKAQGGASSILDDEEDDGVLPE